MEKKRCSWCGDDELYLKYHDLEWGVPVHDDNRLFEFLVLEGAQAGLSFLTILRKRENYRRLFAGFDPAKVSDFEDKKIGELMSDPGIARNRLKIMSAISNAREYLKIQKEFGAFSEYIWKFVDRKTIVNHWRKYSEIPTKTKESIALSKDLKKRGFTFVGPTIAYALMQACGLVNDHEVRCFRHAEIGK